METRKLIEGLFRGDEVAQCELMRQYCDRLTRRARKLLVGLPATASATEVSQSVLGRFLLSARKGRQQEAQVVNIECREDLDQFLYRSVLNRAINERKKQASNSRRPKRERSDEELIATPEFYEQFGQSGIEIATRHFLNESQEKLQSGVLVSPEPESHERGDRIEEIRSWLSEHRQHDLHVFGLEEAMDQERTSDSWPDWLTSSDAPAIPILVEEALEMLDDVTRQILWMRLLGEYPLSEIAERVGVSVPTVRHRIADAIEKWELEFNDRS